VAESPFVPGPLYGLRTWTVVGEPGQERLAGPETGAPWPAGGEWLEAICPHEAHRAPQNDCTCGIYGLHPNIHSARDVLASRFVLAGVVECDGAVEIHAEGFRAERGRPHAFVLTPLRNPALVGRLADAYDAEVATVRGPAELVTWCHDRDLGLEPAAVDRLLGPGTAARSYRERSRRTRRLVGGLLAWLIVSIILSIAAAVAMPGPKGPHEVCGRTGCFQVK
jgi:hypothetical protein